MAAVPWDGSLFMSVLQSSVIVVPFIDFTAHMLRTPVEDFALMESKVSDVLNWVLLKTKRRVLSNVTRGYGSMKIAYACLLRSVER
jgi:hypothetical protein